MFVHFMKYIYMHLNDYIFSQVVEIPVNNCIANDNT